jgi:hypothetical protein
MAVPFREVECLNSGELSMSDGDLYTWRGVALGYASALRLYVGSNRIGRDRLERLGRYSRLDCGGAAMRHSRQILEPVTVSVVYWSTEISLAALSHYQWSAQSRPRSQLSLTPFRVPLSLKKTDRYHNLMRVNLNPFSAKRSWSCNISSNTTQW